MRRMMKVMTIAAGVLGLAAPAAADQVTAVPTAWRLQNYNGDVVAVFYTDAPSCVSGGLVFPSSATVEDKNRFFSMVLAAKLAGHVMSVNYTNISGTCVINDFFMDG